jgi:hypothetical protein
MKINMTFEDRLESDLIDDTLEQEINISEIAKDSDRNTEKN